MYGVVFFVLFCVFVQRQLRFVRFLSLAIIYLNNQEKPDPTVLNRTRLTSINILRGPNTKRLLPSWNADFFFFFSLF